MYYAYKYHRESAGDYQVWLYSKLTGDRKQFVVSFNTRRGAARYCADKNR